MNNQNMTAQEKKSDNWIEMVENFEKMLFYISLFVIPISVIPLPWDITEFSMGLVLLFFSSILIALELVKLVFRGRLLIPKAGIDLGLMLLLGSITLSTIFSDSTYTSLWGYDFRLGSGFILFLVSLIYLYSIRSFLFKYEEVVNSLKFLIAGTSLSAIFSIFSFFGMNILSFIPSFDVLFTTGLPLYSSARLSLVIWGVSLIISIYLSAKEFDKKNLVSTILSVISAIIHLIAIFIFSMVQGWQIFSLLLIATLGFGFYIGLKSSVKVGKGFGIVLYTLLALTIISFVMSLIPFVRNGIGGLSKTLITQISISPDTSLKVLTQTLSQNVTKAVLGVGHDAFSIAYNQFRPLNEETGIVNTTNFTNANNQIYNVMTNRGLLGLAVWIFLGYLIFKYVYENFKLNGFQTEAHEYLFLFDVIAALIFLSSIFIYFNFFITFLLLFSISMSVSLRNMLFKEKLDVWVINLGMFTHTQGNTGLKNTTLGATVLIILLGLLVNAYTFRLGISGFNALQAERITANAREKVEDLSEEDKEKILTESANYYSKAIRNNPENDVLHRRASLIIVQYLEILANRYNKTDEAESKKTLFEQIATYVEISVEESKKATELGPKIYANWSARSSVYSKLVGLGLTSYTKSALTSLQNAATLNPLNFEVYYNAAQLYILNNESDSALRTLNQLFSINPKHIPSLILAGEISFKDKDYKQSERYFTDAKKVMEETNSTSNDIYEYVETKLTEIQKQSPSIQEEVKKEEVNKEGTSDEVQE